MGINELEKVKGASGACNKLRRLVALIFCVFFLGINILPSKTNAQEKTENSGDPFVLNLVEQTRHSRWGPIEILKQGNNQNTNLNDLESFQALSYLQGYNPPAKFRNVILYNRSKSFYGYNLFVSAHAPEAILMDMNGKTIHRWHYSSVFLPGDHRYYADYWVHAHIFKNGDLLALIPFSGLLKIDKNSNLIWFRNITCHHDFDIDSSGNIYTLTIKNSKPGDNSGIKIDSITILSPNGEIKREISLYDLFKKYPDPVYINKINELSRTKDFFYSKNGSRIFIDIFGEAFHSNSIQVLDGKWAFKIPAFKKGNLLISIRHLGVIICVDPDKEEIVWLMDTVFWNQGQHYAKLLDNGNILIFDNYYQPKHSRVVEFDPATKKIVWEYSDPNGRFFSFVIGQCYRLPNGNTLITESVYGHSFEVTPDKKIVWEFYNPHQIDRSNKLFRITEQIQRHHWPGSNYNLIAIIYQMQRIPIDATLDWRATASVRHEGLKD